MAISKITLYLLLILICLGSFLLVLPTINQNIDDPNLIAYFSHDEGYLMDLVWYYYSGQKRDSFQYEADYGIELLYLAGFTRILLSRFMTFTPATFVFILRWFHLFSWLAALLALWHLVSYHFLRLWQSVLAVLLLATSPAFAYLFLSNLKPDPLLLFLVITGLDFTLRIIGDHPRGYLVISVAFLALAFLIKYTGIFLLPAVVIAVFLVSRYKDEAKSLFPTLEASWVFPALCGFLCITAALSTIFIYRRRLTGLTWYQQFGLWPSLSQNKIVFYIILLGIFLISLSLVCRRLKKLKSGWLKRSATIIEELNSYSLIVLVIFILFCLLFGFEWIVQPAYLINAYAQTGRDAFGYASQQPMLQTITLVNFFRNFISKVNEFDVVIFVMFIVYLIVEFIRRHKSFASERTLLFKRVILVVVIAPFFLYMFSGGRAVMHLMLPAFVAAVILSLQGISMISSLLKRRRLPRILFMVSVAILITITIVKNGRLVLDTFRYKYRQHEDIMFDIVKWWRDTYPRETPIIADHPTRAYLPPEYRNVKFLKFQSDRREQLRDLLPSFRPRLIYLNLSSSDTAMEKILPNTNIRLVAAFNNSGRYYKRWPDARYVIYEVVY